MSDKTEPVKVNPPPEPDLSEIQQREAETADVPAVPVSVRGPAHVRSIPNKRCGIDLFPMTTTPQAVVRRDETRAVITLISGVAWEISRTANGQRAPIPANVAIVLTHADAIFASVASAGSTDILTVLTEFIT